VSRLSDLTLCAWFLLVAVGFWGPYLGIPLPSNIANALYAAFLLVAVLTLALRVVGGKHRPEPPVTTTEGEVENV
jgi:hypothetical protein